MWGVRSHRYSHFYILSSLLHLLKWTNSRIQQILGWGETGRSDKKRVSHFLHFGTALSSFFCGSYFISPRSLLHFIAFLTSFHRVPYFISPRSILHFSLLNFKNNRTLKHPSILYRESGAPSLSRQCIVENMTDCSNCNYQCDTIIVWNPGGSRSVQGRVILSCSYLDYPYNHTLIVWTARFFKFLKN